MAKKQEAGNCKHRKIDVNGKNSCDYFDARNRNVKRPLCVNCSQFEAKDATKPEAKADDKPGEKDA